VKKRHLKKAVKKAVAIIGGVRTVRLTPGEQRALARGRRGDLGLHRRRQTHVGVPAVPLDLLGLRRLSN